MDTLLKILNKMLEEKGEALIIDLDGSSSLRRDFNFDSFDLADLTVRIEDELGVDIFENGVIDTIDDIIKQL